jgi:hypothetical protein
MWMFKGKQIVLAAQETAMVTQFLSSKVTLVVERLCSVLW